MVKPGMIKLKSRPGDKKVGSAGPPGGEGGGGEAEMGLGGAKVTCLAASARPKPVGQLKTQHNSIAGCD